MSAALTPSTVCSISGVRTPRVDGRVRADAEQLEPFLRDRLGVDGIQCVEGGGAGRDTGVEVVERGGPAHGGGLPQVAQPVAGHGEQPALRVVRHPVDGPGGERAFERVGEGVFGGGDVAGGRGQHGEQATVRGAGGDLRPRLGTQAAGSRHAPSVKTIADGRTSTAPYCAAGHLPAQSSALSRSGTSITKVPFRRSLVSANGPS